MFQLQELMIMVLSLSRSTHFRLLLGDQEKPVAIMCYKTQKLSMRELKTGEFRVRDGQTLILQVSFKMMSGNYSPNGLILGDIPIIGSFSENRKHS